MAILQPPRAVAAVRRGAGPGCSRYYRPKRAHILEFGAGTGKLAFDILTELAAAGVRSSATASSNCPASCAAASRKSCATSRRWSGWTPCRTFDGVVFGNEVLDAMPVHLVIKNPQGWQELQVTVAEGRFQYLERRPATTAGAGRAPDSRHATAGRLRDRAARHCLRLHGDAGAHAGQGRRLLFDYGFPAHEYYFDQRATGTLMCHYRHHAHPDPFYYPACRTSPPTSISRRWRWRRRMRARTCWAT
jgi:SAM-dependent MidA family methyltransferase